MRVLKRVLLAAALVALVLFGLVLLCPFTSHWNERVDRTKNAIHTVETGLKLYYARHGKYPDTSSGLQVLVAEKMLDKVPKDAWANDLGYENEGGQYKVISFGADGVPGGEEQNADLVAVAPKQ